MPAAALLAIVVATADARDPATAIMIGAAAETLGAEVSVRLVGVDQPGEIDPRAIERDLGASAVVTLVWLDATRLRARLRLHVAAGERSTTRELAFSAADSRAERSRTLGLTAASMWPEITRAARAGPASRAPPEDVAAAPPAARRANEPAAALAGAPTPEGANRARPVERALSVDPIARAAPREPAAGGAPGGARPPARRFHLGVAAIGAAGLDGPGGGIGGRLEAVWRLTPGWSLRTGISLRRGTIAELPAGSDYAAALAAGVEWWPAAFTLGRAARLGIRADGLALRHEVRGTVIAGQPERRARYLPGLDLLAQVALHLGARIDLLVAAGGEMALGTTQVRSGSNPVTVATIPALRLAAEAGLRVGF